MSSSIDIPNAMAHAGPSSSRGSSYSNSPPSSSASSSASSPPPKRASSVRRPSLLSSNLSKEESHVINIGDPEGTPRLITYLSSSQGFVWNPEIFLPSYVDCDYVPLENRRDPVHEIRLSDEETKQLIPQ